MLFEEEKPYQHKEQTAQKYKNSDPVDPMHIAYPAILRRIGIPFLNV
jgi:hypothetical protein